MEKQFWVSTDHQEFLDAAKDQALKASCLRRKCGSVVVSNSKIIGFGANTPPKNLDSQRRCSTEKDFYHKKVTDKTCCVHAEQRAVLDTLRKHPDHIAGATLYFVSVDEDGEVLYSGKLYCTVCSKIVLDSGLKWFVLQHSEEELAAYDTEYYNELSYQFED